MLYCRVKGQAEEAVKAQGLPSLSIFRCGGLGALEAFENGGQAATFLARSEAATGQSPLQRPGGMAQHQRFYWALGFCAVLLIWEYLGVTACYHGLVAASRVAG
jgi:hypothetical protein